MAQTVFILLTTAGADTGPFDLYSDADAYFIPFEVGVPKASLESGYSSILVPDLATTIRVQSTSVLCENYVDLPFVTTTTTTSSTSTTTSTTSTTTTVILIQNCMFMSSFSETVGEDIFVRGNANFAVASTVTIDFDVNTTFDSYNHTVTLMIGNTLSPSLKVLYTGSNPTETFVNFTINSITPTFDGTYTYENCI